MRSQFVLLTVALLTLCGGSLLAQEAAGEAQDQQPENNPPQEKVVDRGTLGRTSGYAASLASLKGVHSFQWATATHNSWGVSSVSCPPAIGAGPGGGGFDVIERTSLGTLTFNGAGRVSATYADLNEFDQAASNATVSCKMVNGVAVVDNGHAVYFISTGTATGTCAVDASGTGSMSLHNPSEIGTMRVTFVLAGSNSRGLSSTLLLLSNEKHPAVGYAFLK